MPFIWRIEVYIVMAMGNDGPEVEAVFAHLPDAERYSTMGDMWVETWSVTPEGAEPQTTTISP
jgi:hypothetical protein